MKITPDREPSFSFTAAVVHHTEERSALKIAGMLTDIFKQIESHRPVVFVCIGTDRSTGDSLGPLVGTRLKTYNSGSIHLFGTLENPVHAMNLGDCLDEIQSRFENPFIVGIDACLGLLSSVGSIKLASGPLKPGAGVNKDLPSVGDMHITGIVNVGGFMEYFVLQNTRLHLVMSLAELIAKAVYLSLLNCGRLTVTGIGPAIEREDLSAAAMETPLAE